MILPLNDTRLIVRNSTIVKLSRRRKPKKPEEIKVSGIAHNVRLSIDKIILASKAVKIGRAVSSRVYFVCVVEIINNISE